MNGPYGMLSNIFQPGAMLPGMVPKTGPDDQPVPPPAAFGPPGMPMQQQQKFYGAPLPPTPEEEARKAQAEAQKIQRQLNGPPGPRGMV